MKNDNIYEENKKYLLSLDNPNIFMLQERYDNKYGDTKYLAKCLVILLLTMSIFILPILISTGFIIGGTDYMLRNLSYITRLPLKSTIYHIFLVIFGFSILFLILFTIKFILDKEKK